MKLKKSHVPVILASILLVILVGTLIYVIFFMKESTKTNLFAKKISDYKVEIKVATYDDNSEPVDYEHMDYKEAKVTNYVNNALVDNEILSSDIEVLPISDGFIVYSTSNDSFIMKTDNEFKTKWISKFSKDNYKVETVAIKDNKIYAILSKDKKVYGVSLDSKGKKSKYTEITTYEKYNSFDVVAVNDSFIGYIEKSPIIKFIKINFNFKLEDNTYNLHEVHPELVGSNLLIQDITSKDDKVYFYLQSFYKGGTNNLVTSLDSNLKEVKYKNINDLLNDKLSYKLFNNNFYVNTGKVVKVFNIDSDNTLTKDYTTLLGDNEIPIMMYVYGDNDNEILYVNTGTYYSIDTINNSKIKNTIVAEYKNDEIKSVPISALYKNNKLYLLSNANNYSLYLNKYEF